MKRHCNLLACQCEISSSLSTELHLKFVSLKMLAEKNHFHCIRSEAFSPIRMTFPILIFTMEEHYGLTGTSDGQCDSHSSDLCAISRQWNNILSSPFPHTVLEQPFFSFFLLLLLVSMNQQKGFF